MLETIELTKTHGEGATAVKALAGVSLKVSAGDFVAVMGPSGCGKSTLLHLCGGLDRPTSGRVLLDGADLGRMHDDALTELRRRQIGFIFQFFNLVPVLDAVENAALPLVLDGVPQAAAQRTAAGWLEKVGLGERLHHLPSQLSGGQQQRVAIARALVANPRLLLADEPTGNLDTRASGEIAALLRQAATEWGRTVLMVTHDPSIAAHASRIVFLKDGRVVDDAALGRHSTAGDVAAMAGEAAQ
jgi:putative ABC transport system ATP-binding protein